MRFSASILEDAAAKFLALHSEYEALVGEPGSARRRPLTESDLQGHPCPHITPPEIALPLFLSECFSRLHAILLELSNFLLTVCSNLIVGRLYLL